MPTGDGMGTPSGCTSCIDTDKRLSRPKSLLAIERISYTLTRRGPSMFLEAGPLARGDASG